MRIIDGLQQGTPEWLAWRRAGLGGSDASAIMHVSPWQTARGLWEVRTGRAPAEDSTFAMRRGLRLEPQARQLYARRSGLAVRPACVLHVREDWLRASLDGLDALGDLVVEIKCPNLADHQQALAGQVPAHYWPQVQHELLVTGAGRLDYASYSEHRMFAREQRLAVVPVAPDPAYMERLLFAEWLFWGCVRMDLWPEFWSQMPAAATPHPAPPR